MAKKYEVERTITNEHLKQHSGNVVQYIEDLKVALYEELITTVGRTLKVHYNFRTSCVGSPHNRCLILSASGVIYE